MTPLIDLKDIAGLSAPLVKLIETIGAGGGRVSDGISRIANVYLLASRDAKNEAERIQLVEGAKTKMLVERTKELAALSGRTGSLLQTVDIAGETISAHLAEVPAELRELHERSAAYSSYHNAWQQLNREAVFGNAAAVLDGESEVDANPVNPTIAARILNIIQDISDVEAQALWGNILAGEVKKTGSFSLRTLDVLRNLDAHDAQLFKRVADFAIRSQESCMIAFTPMGLSNNIIDKYYKFSYANLLELTDSGLVIPGDHGIRIGIQLAQQDMIMKIFRMADQVIVLESETSTHKQATVFVLSPAGSQLYKLIAVEAKFSREYLRDFTAPLRSQGVRIKYGKFIAELPDGSFTYELPLQELTD